MPPADHLTSRRSRRRRGAYLLSAGAATLGVAALLAGCGGGSSPGVASVGNSKSSSSQSAAAGGGAADGAAGGGSPRSLGSGSGGGQAVVSIAGGSRQDALKFSACMRANGVPNFPDPNSQGAVQFGSADGIDPRSSQFQAAQKKCAKYRGGGHAPSPAKQAQAQAQALRFSACMRSHGVPDFPDPQFSSNGGIGIRLHGGPGSGLDPGSPIFQAAQKACSADLPGGGPQAAPGE